MTPRTRRTVLLSLAAAAVATAALALGLPLLRLGPGMPLLGEGGEASLDLPGAAGALPVQLRPAVLWVLAGSAMAALGWALWRALRGVRLRSVVRGALRVLLAGGALAGGLALFALLEPHARLVLEAPLPPPPAPAPRTPLGHPPTLVFWLSAAALLATGAAAAAWLSRRPTRRTPLDALGLAAEHARADLLAGADARDAVIRCYARMSAALEEEQGIARPGPMTPREFEDQLGGLGFPLPPVHELTRLFERARYGRHAPSDADGQRALSCLDAVVDHCRAAGEEPR